MVLNVVTIHIIRTTKKPFFFVKIYSIKHSSISEVSKDKTFVGMFFLMKDSPPPMLFLSSLMGSLKPSKGWSCQGEDSESQFRTSNRIHQFTKWKQDVERSTWHRSY